MAIIAIIVLLYQSYLLISDLKIGYIIGTLIYILLSAIIAQVSNKKNKIALSDIHFNTAQSIEKSTL